jgi:hypothetical protein
MVVVAAYRELVHHRHEAQGLDGGNRRDDEYQDRGQLQTQRETQQESAACIERSYKTRALLCISTTQAR